MIFHLGIGIKRRIKIMIDWKLGEIGMEYKEGPNSYTRLEWKIRKGRIHIRLEIRMEFEEGPKS